MILIYTVMLIAVLSFVSGLLAVGSGKEWHFSVADILRGRVNAILYVWVTFSTIISAWRIYVDAEWRVELGSVHYAGTSFQAVAWWFQGAAAVLMISAHLFIRQSLSSEGGLCGNDYLWGTRARAE